MSWEKLIEDLMDIIEGNDGSKIEDERLDAELDKMVKICEKEKIRELKGLRRR